MNEMDSGVTEIRSLLDSFNLIGRRIWNVWTTSFDFFNNKEGLEDSVCSDLGNRVGLSDNAACSASSIHALARRARIERRMEIDKPFVIEFDSPPAWSTATDEDRMRTKRERCHLCLSETLRWSHKAIPAEGRVRIEL